jgi:hypothetical protein
MGMLKKKKCRNCRRLFLPDYRNYDRQKYCERAECRKASKAASQRKWLDQPENQDYFRGPENVERVQEWRNQNPEYWKQKSPNKGTALQEPLTVQLTENNQDKHQITNMALQDFLEIQPAVIIGLISNFIGSTLQEDISETLLRMRQSGQDILYRQLKEKGGRNDWKIPNSAEAGAKSTQKLQLDRSPAGK